MTAPNGSKNRPASLAEVAAVLEDLPNMVRVARRMRGLSLRDATEQSGVGFNTLSRLERGRDVSLANAVALLRWLGAS